MTVTEDEEVELGKFRLFARVHIIFREKKRQRRHGRLRFIEGALRGVIINSSSSPR